MKGSSGGFDGAIGRQMASRAGQQRMAQGGQPKMLTHQSQMPQGGQMQGQMASRGGKGQMAQGGEAPQQMQGAQMAMGKNRGGGGGKMQNLASRLGSQSGSGKGMR